jgi:hypothetical protein
MRVLITGITGFVGSHMAEYALAKGAQVFGSNRWRSKTENIDHLRDKVTFIESDLRDLSSVRSLLEISQPDFVVHLAAQSFVGVSWHAPAETLTTNIISQVHLLEAIRGLKMSPRFLAVGSSEEYGLVQPDELPITEDNPLRPLSPYAVSKVTQDMMAFQYFKSYGLPDQSVPEPSITRARGAATSSSPRTSPGRSRRSRLACASLCSTWGISPRAVTTPMCGTSCAATGCSSRRVSRARSTISARARRGPSSRCSTSSSASRR